MEIEKNPDFKIRYDIWRLVTRHSKKSGGKKIMSSIKFDFQEQVGKKGPVYELKMITTTWKYPKKKANLKRLK